MKVYANAKSAAAPMGGLRSEVPLMALFGLMHLRVALTGTVLGRTRSRNQHDVSYGQEMLDARHWSQLRWSKRLDQTDPFGPRHNEVHFVKEHAFACALGDKLKSGGGKADLFHRHITLLMARRLAGFCR